MDTEVKKPGSEDKSEDKSKSRHEKWKKKDEERRRLVKLRERYSGEHNPVLFFKS